MLFHKRLVRILLSWSSVLFCFLQQSQPAFADSANLPSRIDGFAVSSVDYTAGSICAHVFELVRDRVSVSSRYNDVAIDGTEFLAVLLKQGTMRRVGSSMEMPDRDMTNFVGKRISELI